MRRIAYVIGGCAAVVPLVAGIVIGQHLPPAALPATVGLLVGFGIGLPACLLSIAFARRVKPNAPPQPLAARHTVVVVHTTPLASEPISQMRTHTGPAAFYAEPVPSVRTPADQPPFRLIGPLDADDDDH